MHGDPVDPGTEIGPGFKPLELAIAAQKRVLHDLFGVGLVARDPIGHAENRAAVLCDQGPVGILVPGENGTDRCVVALAHALD